MVTRIYKIGSEIWGTPKQIWRRKDIKTWEKFKATSQLDRVQVSNWQLSCEIGWRGIGVSHVQGFALSHVKAESDMLSDWLVALCMFDPIGRQCSPWQFIGVHLQKPFTVDESAIVRVDDDDVVQTTALRSLRLCDRCVAMCYNNSRWHVPVWPLETA